MLFLAEIQLILKSKQINFTDYSTIYSQNVNFFDTKLFDIIV